MCVKCTVNDALTRGDYDEASRLIDEEKKAVKSDKVDKVDKVDEHDDVKAEAAEEKAAEKASSKAGE